MTPLSELVVSKEWLGNYLETEWTLISMLCSGCASDRNARNSVSAMYILDPCTYRIDSLYRISRSSTSCRRGDALWRGFRVIVSNGRWSLWTSTSRPYMYWWNLSTANTMHRSSRSICAYLLSVSVRARDAYATG